MRITRTVTPSGKLIPKTIADARCHGATHSGQSKTFVFHTTADDHEQFAVHLSHDEVMRALGQVAPLQLFDESVEKSQRYVKVLRELRELLTPTPEEE